MQIMFKLDFLSRCREKSSAGFQESKGEHKEDQEEVTTTTRGEEWVSQYR